MTNEYRANFAERLSFLNFKITPEFFAQKFKNNSTLFYQKFEYCPSWLRIIRICVKNVDKIYTLLLILESSYSSIAAVFQRTRSDLFPKFFCFTTSFNR
jgi:hypothetical protein